MHIGIIGNGFVGKATSILENDAIQIKIYDKDPKLCSPVGTCLEDLLSCAVVFISVPTPMNSDGSCCLTIIENVFHDLKKIGFSGYKVIRSTVPVGTSDQFHCHFMPEFLTEKDYENDFRTNKFWIFGEKEKDETFREKMKFLFSSAKRAGKIESDKIKFLPNKEAEMVKLFRNCFLATKVSFCNEIHEFCEKKGINYYSMSLVACDDDRITTSHSAVPGHDGKFGFGGTCFPKDTASLLHQMETVKQKSFLLKAAVDRNTKVDRQEEDWKLNKGRAVNF